MTEIKIGDKVRVIQSESNSVSGAWVGVEGVVESVIDGFTFFRQSPCFEVRLTRPPLALDNWRVGDKVTLSSLEKVEPAVDPHFQQALVDAGLAVGDKVHVVQGLHKGKEAEIIPNPRGQYIKAKLSNTVGDDYPFIAKELKLVKPDFKKGDIVKPIDFKYLNHEGKQYFIVDSVNELAKYPVRVRALGDVDSRGYKHEELEAGEPLAFWELELLDHPAYVAAKAKVSDPRYTAKVIGDFSCAKVTGYSKDEGVGLSRYTAGMPKGVEARHIMSEQGWYEAFAKGSILKYITRLDHKGQYLSDLKKIKTYAEELIRLAEADA